MQHAWRSEKRVQKFGCKNEKEKALGIAGKKGKLVPVLN
jgi:hypothetical protein